MVEQAYISPEVDSDKTEFQWGYRIWIKLGLFNVQPFWTQTEVDEVMVPLVQDMNKKN